MTPPITQQSANLTDNLMNIPPQPAPVGIPARQRCAHPESVNGRSFGDDVPLFRCARNNDQQAWNDLVERYTPMLWSTALKYRLSTADAADAVQITWLRLLEHLDEIQDPTRLAGWLNTTLLHECLRHLRRARRERPHPAESTADIPDPVDAIDTDLIRAERNAALRAAFNQLPDHCQRLLRRLITTSQPDQYKTAATLLNIPIGSVGPTRMRCLSALRRLLELPTNPEP